MPTVLTIHAEFVSAAIEDRQVWLRDIHGREGLSELFDFDLTIALLDDQPLTLASFQAILDAPALVAIGPEREHKIRGVARAIEAVPYAGNGPHLYRIRFVPKLFDASMTCGSWVYQDMSVSDIVADVLTECGFDPKHDFEFRLAGRYDKQEYVVQYEESDLDFISRLMEHAGIFYFFEHGDDDTKLVIADSNKAFAPLANASEIPFEPARSGAAVREAVTAIGMRLSPLPRALAVKDFNYRTPMVQLVGTETVDAQHGIGVRVIYGEHFKTPDAAKRLAKLRAEQLHASQKVFHAESDVSGLRSGHKFNLEGHPGTDYGIAFVVTSVTHDLVHPVRSGTEMAAEQSQSYRNHLTLIPAAVEYRPPLATPKPRVYGVTHATIDAASDDGVTAPIDDQGRYKVVLPFDVGARSGGTASRWIRMAQPSSGAGYGVHFPLHAGTEVLLVHIDGDPDRPIIIGSVPNTVLQNPVTAQNATQSMIRTRTGIMVTFDDASDANFDDAES